MRALTHDELLTASLDIAARQADMNESVREEFTKLIEDGVVTAVYPFGSVQFDDATLASDYDCLVVLPESGVEAETESLQAIHDVAKRFYARYGMPFEVSCYTDGQLIRGQHELPDIMLNWLKSQAATYDERHIGPSFVHLIEPKQKVESVDVLSNLDEFVNRTSYVLKKQWLQGVCFKPHDVLGLVLSTPHIIGRKVIDTLQDLGAVDFDGMPDLKKASIDEAFLALFGADSKIGTLYQSIAEDRRRYIDELMAQAKDLTMAEYDHIIEATLEDDLPQCIELLRRIQESYRESYERTISWKPGGTNFEKAARLIADVATYRHSRMVDEVRADQVGSI